MTAEAAEPSTQDMWMLRMVEALQLEFGHFLKASPEDWQRVAAGLWMKMGLTTMGTAEGMFFSDNDPMCLTCGKPLRLTSLQARSTLGPWLDKFCSEDCMMSPTGNE